MRPREVFFSHASADKKFAQRLIAALEANLIRTWFAPYTLVGSQTWHDEIGKALERCDWFVVLLSKSGIRSKWVKKELLFALDEKRYEDRIIPVLAEDCAWKKQLSWTLGAIQRVDFRADFEEGVRDLLRVWNLAPGSTVTRPTKRKPRRKPKRRKRG